MEGTLEAAGVTEPVTFTAVALGAFVLRTVLVPAAMHLFGDANWWLPRWLDRILPHLAIEPPQETPAPAPTAPAAR